MENVEFKEEIVKDVEILDPYGFIYITTNIINGKKYIGQRKFSHGWKGYLGSGKYFLRSVKKYGKENFLREIIAIVYSIEELDKLEIEFIKNHSAVESEDYYNISCGGGTNAGIHLSEETKQKIGKSNTGKKHSEETKRKLSDINKGEKSPKYGKKLSKETREKMSAWQIGKKFSEESKKKMSIAQTGKILSEETKQKMRNRRHSEETKQKMSMKRKGLNDDQVSEIRRKYSTGKYTQKDLAEEYLVSGCVISNVINYKHAYK